MESRHRKPSKEVGLERTRASAGKVALVDDSDFEWLSRWKWSAKLNKRQNKWYGYRRSPMVNGKITGPNIYLHRQIMGCVKGDGIQVDHANGDSLDNRRENLRVCTQTQNNANSKRRRDSNTKYRGVCYIAGRNKPWRAAITDHYRFKVIGMFYTEEEAALAYNNKALELWGEFARLNVLTPPAPPAPLSVVSTLPEFSHSAQSLRLAYCGASA